MPLPEDFNYNNPTNDPGIAEGLTLYREHYYGRARTVWLQLAAETDSALVKVVATHHAASASGRLSQLADQGDLNEDALVLLTAVEDADIVEAYNLKIGAGLYESGHRAWDEQAFAVIVYRMVEMGHNDAPGRVAFLAKRLTGEQRTNEALALLQQLEANIVNSMNAGQLERALLLMQSIEAQVNDALTGEDDDAPESVDQDGPEGRPRGSDNKE